MVKKTIIKTLGDRVLIEPLSREEKDIKTKSGIIIPDTVGDREKIDRGIVIEVGPGRLGDDGKRLPLSVKKGQMVIFSEYSADKIKVEDKEYLIVNEGNILAIIE